MTARGELLAQLAGALPVAEATLERLVTRSQDPRIRAQAAALLARHCDRRGHDRAGGERG